MRPTTDAGTSAKADEAAAEALRRQLREQGIVAIEPDARIASILGPDERLIAVRRAVTLDRRATWRDPRHGLDGDLYVTTARLVYVGRAPIDIALDEIRDAQVVDGALLLVIGEYRGITIWVRDPRQLRVLIAAARGAVRAVAR